MYCSDCGNKLEENMSVCPQCGHPANSNSFSTFNSGMSAAVSGNFDIPNPGLCVLSFFLPIFGIVLSLAMHRKTPYSCRRYLTWSLVSIGLSLLFTLSYIITFVGMILHMTLL